MIQKAFVYQIFHSEETRRKLTPGFIPIDNGLNQRPDWKEYWPMRWFIGNTPLESDAWYGFLAPNFGEQTRLSADQLRILIERAPPDSAVILFSADFAKSAFSWNVFEQAEVEYPGFVRVCDLLAAKLGLPVPPSTIVNCSCNTVFGNCFVAKPDFWTVWFQIAEAVFVVAENDRTELGAVLRAVTGVGDGSTTVKTLVVERIASYLLATDRRWKVHAGNLPDYPHPDPPTNDLLQRLFTLDALKHAFAVHSVKGFKDAFSAFQA